MKEMKNTAYWKAKFAASEAQNLKKASPAKGWLQDAGKKVEGAAKSEGVKEGAVAGLMSGGIPGALKGALTGGLMGMLTKKKKEAKKEEKPKDEKQVVDQDALRRAAENQKKAN